MFWGTFEAWLNSSPPWLIGVVLFGSVTVALLLGCAVGARLARPPGGETESFVVASVFGLLALLLGFTFALAIDRYEARRILVQQEANAINTVFTRAQLLEEPHRSRIRAMLVEFTANRIVLAEAAPDRNRQRLLEANDRLVAQFWAASAAAFPSIDNGDFASGFIESANELINMEATRKSARVARVPVAVFALLMIYVVVSAGVLGLEARERRTLWLSAVFISLLVLSLMLVIDIDRPALGGVREPQGAMERLLDTMRAPYPG